MLRLLLTFLLVISAAAPTAAQTAGRQLVVPFENSRSEPRFQWLSEASAVLLTDGLRARGVDAITRFHRVSAFEQLHLPIAASLSRATVIRVGQLLAVSEVIVGSFTVEGEQLTVSAHAIRVDFGRVTPAATERGALTDLFAIYDRLTARLSRDAPISRAASVPPPPLDAFENFIKGLLAENPATRASFLEAAVREHTDFDRARLALWEVRTDQGDHDSALATVRAVRPESPLSRRARFAAGVSLMELKRYDEAFTGFKALLDEVKAPEAATAAILNNLGVVQLRRGQSPASGSATYYLTKAADADTDPDYLFNLGYAYVAEGNHSGAVYWLREALRRDPTDADAHFVLAAALQTLGSAVEASRERDLARQLSARYEEMAQEGTGEKATLPGGLERVAMELETSQALRADKVAVTSAQREQQELATFHLDRGRRFFQKEQDREAMAELRRVVYLSPYEAEAHLLIGRIHLRSGLPGDAIDALKISIWSQETAAARVTLGEAYLKAGNNAAAKEQAERALTLSPDSAEAKQLLSRIK
jgi:Tfp pilus assembly protein PilF/TolB-like protein